MSESAELPSNPRPPLADAEDFLAASRVVGVEDGRFAATIPAGWEQGRGAFGGLVVAMLARAAAATEPDERRELRSITAEIAAPVLVGAVSIEVAVLRRGAGVTVLRASMAQAGAFVAGATVALASDRNVDRVWSPAPPADLHDHASFPPAPVGPPMAPVFTQHVELRARSGFPFSGAATPDTDGWVRFRRPVPLDPGTLLALADAWWPTALVQETAPRPMSTLAFTAQVYPPTAPLDPSQPLRHRARGVRAGGGFLAEHRELWSPAGELLVLNQQTFVWIKLGRVAGRGWNRPCPRGDGPVHEQRRAGSAWS